MHYGRLCHPILFPSAIVMLSYRSCINSLKCLHLDQLHKKQGWQDVILGPYTLRKIFSVQFYVLFVRSSEKPQTNTKYP